jgi:hypothetical protein
MVNNKLCNIFRAPGDYVDFSSADEVVSSDGESSDQSDADEQERAYLRLFKRN